MPSLPSRLRVSLAAALVLSLCFLLVPTAALAHRHRHTLAPPGNSAVSQYVEDVPTAKGDRPSSTIHRGGSGGGHTPQGGSPASGGGPSNGSGGDVSSRALHSLARHGSIGRGAAAFAAATAPGSAARRPGRGAPVGLGGSSALGSLVRAATGSSSGDGLGSLLWIIFAVIAAGGLGLAFTRRRPI